MKNKLVWVRYSITERVYGVSSVKNHRLRYGTDYSVFRHGTVIYVKRVDMTEFQVRYRSLIYIYIYSSHSKYKFDDLFVTDGTSNIYPSQKCKSLGAILTNILMSLLKYVSRHIYF